MLPVSVCLVLGVGFVVRHLLYRNGQPYAQYFLPGLLLKIIGAVLFCAIYRFYYPGGDTTVYYDHATILYNHFFENPARIWEIWRAAAGTETMQTAYITEQMPFYYSENTYMVIRIAALLGLFSGNSFWATSVFFAALGFTGAWAMYRVFTSWYPQLYRSMALVVFALPSVVFWGSGLMKDTIALGCLGWLLYALNNLFIQKKHLLISAALALLTAYLIGELKAYIAVGFAPAVIWWVIASNLSMLPDTRLRAFAVILGLVGLGFYAYLFSNNLAALFMKFFGKFVEMAIGFQSWHGFLYEQQGQSGYSLGEMTFTPLGILSKFPAAVNVALFRPYLFEANSPVVLITAIESTFMLFFTVYILLKVGILRTLRLVFTNPEIALCFWFSIIFAFAVGFSSYNFGALARYKIPCLPFYAAMLFMVLHRHRLACAANLPHPAAKAPVAG
ncbi:hypothetical protein C7N43_25025 [Sphingobacteriales bacterium UPWRP_1]|nr:hypothetical protein BVG80_17145 [Sphingobacteriales bacterium TSM_CSM]PSJ74225.1 hypothetical protein C7N43_25025 [Sphingobacteriales bacterium UPWRP_1]